MLDRIFLQILDLSVSASFVIVAVLLARLALRRAPKICSYVLWGAVLLRLLFPWSIQSPAGVVPEVASLSGRYSFSGEEISLADAGAAAYQTVGDSLRGSSGTQRIPTGDSQPDGSTRYVTASREEVWLLAGKYVWAAGVTVMTASSVFSCLRLRRRLRTAIPMEKNVYLTEEIQSPFVMGLIHPEIYLPATLNGKEQKYILLHERHHIRRGDHVWKLLGFAALTLHWFNPLVWVSFLLAGRDMEMSCDEAVIRRLGDEVRADYSASLLSLATGSRILSGTPLAFGEGDPGSRIRNLARWKRPAAWALAVILALCLLFCACLLTNRTGTGSDAGITWYSGTLVKAEGETLTLRLPDGEELEFQTEKTDVLNLTGGSVRICSRIRSVTGARLATSVKASREITASSLEEAVYQSVLLQNDGPRYEGDLPTAGFVTIADSRDGDLLTVYGIASFHVFRLEGEILADVSGSIVPVALTFFEEEGTYTLREYWEPRDGSLYPKDIQAKFPLFAQPDTQKYSVTLSRALYSQAEEVFGRDVVIATLLEDIRVRDQWAEDFESLMSMCRCQRELLVSYGEGTLAYCFRKLEEGVSDEVLARVMAYVCGETMETMGERDLPDWSGSQSGAAWFEAFAENARRLAMQGNGDPTALKEKYPGSYAYLTLTGGAETGK